MTRHGPFDGSSRLRSGLTVAAVGALLAIAGVWVRAQQPATQDTPTFRAGTDLVQVDVSVLDGDRHPVRGLTAADFTILVDGQPRPVEAFTEVDLPTQPPAGEAAWMSEVPADVASNRDVGTEGRLVVIVMDRTIPVGQPTLVARNTALAAIDALGPTDMAAVVSTSGGVPQDFTSDRTRLRRAVGRRDWSTDISDDAKAIEAAILGPAADLFTPLTDPRCLCGLCVPDTVTRVAEALESVPRRRKSLLFIGSDFIVQAGPQLQQADLACGQKLKEARDVMFSALDRSGVIVHAFDPSGLNPIGPMGSASSPLTAGRSFGGRGSAVSDLLKRQGNLHVVPDHTGGRVVMNTNAPEVRVPDVMRESQSYYLLGFSASDANPDGTEHTIAVKVDRRGVKVQARRRFVQPVASHAPTTDDSTSPAAAALTGLLPDPALPLALHLGTFASPNGGLPTVTVALGINAFGPSAAAETTDTPLQVIVAALDPTGRPVASARQTVDLAWPRPDAGRRPDVEALTHLALPAGDYQIRVAVENQRTHEVSSVFDYVTVPSFASVPFSLSTIAIGAPTTTASVPPGALRDLLPVAPTTSRAFSRRADVPAFMRVYQGTERTDAIEPVSVRVRIMDDQDRALRDEALPLGADAFADGRTADCHLTLPVSQLPPGNYLLRVEASMGERLAGRAIRFSVTD